jgi:hypothetical protein
MYRIVAIELLIGMNVACSTIERHAVAPNDRGIVAAETRARLHRRDGPETGRTGSSWDGVSDANRETPRNVTPRIDDGIIGGSELNLINGRIESHKLCRESQKLRH